MNASTFHRRGRRVRRESLGFPSAASAASAVAALAEGLLAHYAGKPLVDAFDVYQHLMDSDMDVEIAALEAKMTKARALKQGMMQELLTRRIRLV